MGELLPFPSHRTERGRRAPAAPPAFFFDLSCPFSYLTAERVERSLGEVEWVAVDGGALGADSESPAVRARAEARARVLRLPLVWPDAFPSPAHRALRAAAFACELGAGAAFALAASRLAFCGGFDIDDPEVLAEAAAAAAIPLRACLEAARDAGRDEQLHDTAVALRAVGVRRLPAFRVADRWLQGEDGLRTAAALRHAPTTAPSRAPAPGSRPLEPVC